MNFCNFHQFETIKYAESLDIQRTIFNEMIEQKKMGKTPKHHLFFVEHPAVYTLGKHANATNFILQPDALKAIGADIHEIERGGDITFHGPGQLVVYPLFDLEQLNIGLKRYVQLIEKCIIDTLKEFEITAGFFFYTDYPHIIHNDDTTFGWKNHIRKQLIDMLTQYKVL
jgi:lipoyl(octanoyl) transferase